MKTRLELDVKQPNQTWADVNRTLHRDGWQLVQSVTDYRQGIVAEGYMRQGRGPLGRFRRHQHRIVLGRTVGRTGNV